MLPKDIFDQHIHIGLDLDETLAATTTHMLGELHAMGKFLSIPTMEELTNFEWYKLDGCDMELSELYAFWRSHLISDCLPIEYAIEGVSQLESKGKNLSIITARNSLESSEDVVQWATRFYPTIPREKIHFANHISEKDKIPKSVFCKKHGVTLMIDDAIHNIEDLLENGITCILIEKPWNKNYNTTHPLLHRISNWQEVIDNLR